MRLTDTPPAFCTSCGSQHIDQIHVDLDCAYDGPVERGANGDVLPHENVILCETCVREANTLLPDHVELKIAYDELYSNYERMHTYTLRLERGLDELKLAISDKPTAPKRRAVAKAA